MLPQRSFFDGYVRQRNDGNVSDEYHLLFEATEMLTDKHVRDLAQALAQRMIPLWPKMRESVSREATFQASFFQNEQRSISPRDLASFVDGVLSDVASSTNTRGDDSKPQAIVWRFDWLSVVLLSLGLFLYWIGIHEDDDTKRQIGLYLIALAWIWTFILP